MPNRIGNQGLGNTFFNNLNQSSVKGEVKTNRAKATQAGDNAKNGNVANVDNTFIAFDGTDGDDGGFFPALGENILHDLDVISQHFNGDFKVGSYSKGGNHSYGLRGTHDSNTQTTNWKKRVDWKGSTDRTVEGQGTTRGPQVKAGVKSNKTLFSGMAIADRTVGVEGRVGGDLEGKYGKMSGSARVYSEATAKASAGYSVTSHGAEVNVGAEVGVTALGVEAYGKMETPSTVIGGQKVNLQADVYGHAAIEANAKLSASAIIDRDPPKAILVGKAGAFAGAKASGRARFGISDILRVGVYGEGWAGAGAEASGQVGYDNGKFSFGGSLGAGLGLGGKVGFRVDFDAIKAAKVAKELADVDGNGKLTLNDGATAITKTADASLNLVDKAVTGAMNALDADRDGRFSMKDMGLHASRLRNQLQSSLDVNKDGKVGLQDLATGVEKGLEGLGKAAISTGKAVLDGIETFDKATLKLVNKTGHAIADGAHDLADRDGDGHLGLNDLKVGARELNKAAHTANRVLNNAAIKTGHVIADATKTAGHAIADGADKLAHGAHDLADRDGDGHLGLNDIAAGSRQLGNATIKAGHLIAHNTGAAMRATHRAMDQDGDGHLGLNDISAGLHNMASGAESAGKTLVSGAKTIGHGAVKIGRELGSQALEAADTLKTGASRTYNKAKSIGKKVASFFGW